jgi:hypothetical protein
LLYLELHGAFSIALRAPGAALLRRLGFLAGRGARGIAFAVVLVGGVLRGGGGGEKVATLLRELLRTHNLSLLLTVGRCGEVGETVTKLCARTQLIAHAIPELSHSPTTSIRNAL